MIYTSSYENSMNANIKKFSLSKKNFMNAENISIFNFDIPVIDDPSSKYIEIYIEEYYNKVLSKLDIEETYKHLNNSVLISEEEPHILSNRHIIAEWFYLFLNKEVKEVKISDSKTEFLDRDINIRNVLEKIVKKNIDMGDFNSIRAYFLDKKIDNIISHIDNIDKNIEVLRKIGLLRVEVECLENEYNYIKKAKKICKRV